MVWEGKKGKYFPLIGFSLERITKRKYFRQKMNGFKAFSPFLHLNTSFLPPLPFLHLRLLDQKGTIELSDLFEPSENNRCQHLTKELERSWNIEIEKAAIYNETLILDKGIC